MFQEFGGPLNLAALCGRIGRILAKAGSEHNDLLSYEISNCSNGRAVSTAFFL